MVYIAICDDMASDSGELKAHIEKYLQANAIQGEISCFHDRDEIINAVDDADEYDVLFLDIYMEALNGIDLARHIRKNDSKCRIVFFSTSREHALDAFGVNASQYLVKPVDYASLANAMDVALEQLNKREEVISIVTGSEVIKLPLEEIMYSESQQHYQYIYMSGGSIERARMSCAELYDMLSGKPEFIRVGVSFIVNLKHVMRISAKDVMLSSGQNLPVPRGSFAVLKQKYIEYYMGS